MKMTGERFIPNRMMVLSEIEHMHRYHAVKSVLKQKVVLDAACGAGYGSSIISEVADTVYGIDISEEAVNYANEHYGNDKVKYQLGSIEKLEFPDKYFDAIVSFETIEHVNEDMQLKFIKEIRRVLKDDGILIMSTPDKKVYTDEQSGIQTEWHVKEFYADEFHDFINAEFSNITTYYQYMGETSLIVDSYEEKLNKINFDTIKEGKFIIVIASNTLIPTHYSIGSSYYCGTEYSDLDDFIQVYFSKANDMFSESQYQMKEISRKNKYVKKQIWLDGEQVKNIRIDPLSINCELVINKITIVLMNDEKIGISDYKTNADLIENDRFIFYHKDPQIIINLDKEVLVKYIDIDFIINDYDIDIYPKYNILKKTFEDEINQLKREISEYRDLLLFEKGKNCTLNEFCDRKDIKINELNNQLENITKKLGGK